MTNQTRKQVSRAEFEKRVETAAAYMEYMDRMSKQEAATKARAEVSREYEVVSEM